MELTHDFRETVQDRLRRDPEFRECVLAGEVESLLSGEVGVAKMSLRDYIIVTVGFEELGVMTGRAAESVTYMFGPEGAPSAGDLFEVLACLLRHEGLVLQVSAVRGDDRTAVDPMAEALSSAAG